MKDKNEYSKHERKYIGVIFKIKRFNYYAPFSMAKDYDYDFNGQPKDSSPFVLRMIDLDVNRRKIIGKIIINCMIPVPDKFIIRFDINKIKDEKYKSLLQSEFIWVNKNQILIQEKATNVYKVRNNKIVLPFHRIEKYVNKHFK